jgi:hypothetical protein
MAKQMDPQPRDVVDVAIESIKAIGAKGIDSQILEALEKSIRAEWGGRMSHVFAKTRHEIEVERPAYLLKIRESVKAIGVAPTARAFGIARRTVQRLMAMA